MRFQKSNNKYRCLKLYFLKKKNSNKFKIEDLIQRILLIIYINYEGLLVGLDTFFIL